MSSDFLSTSTGMLAWLRDSGIQIPEGEPDAGGVYAWLDEDTATPSFVYAEITGYFMSLAVHLHRLDPNGGWLERAEAAGRWITDVAQHESGAILPRKYAPDQATAAATDPYSFRRANILYFDCAMVGFGLLCTYDATKNERWIQAATKLGNYMLRAFESPDQTERHAAHDLHANQALPAGERWSAHFAGYELKGAMFFHRLAELSGDARFSEHLERVLTQALATQQDNGRFPTNRTQTATHLHPHSYTLEGLLYLVARAGRRELLPAIRRGVAWSFATCLPVHGDRTPEPAELMHQWSDDPELVFRALRSDTLAQTIRAARLYEALSGETDLPWKTQLGPLTELRRSYALPSGAVGYGEDEYGTKSRHANSWCTFFSIEQEIFAAQADTGKLLDPASIIIT